MARASAKGKALEGDVIDAPKGSLLRPVPGSLLPGVAEDEQIVQSAGRAILEFLRGVAGFFLTASAIERSAVATLTRAKALTLPANIDEDAALQRFIKETTAQTKVAVEHWKITATVSGFHRRMTAARARATDPLKEANDIGNRLHNRYVDEANRRAAAEQERLRREREDAARLESERAQAELEAEAAKRELASPDLSTREEVFVTAMVEGAQGALAYRGNPQACAGYAGYKDKVVSAARLMAAPKIQAAIAAKTEAFTLRQQAAAKKAAPLVYDEPDVKPAIAEVGNDRTTWAGELLDEAALMEAFLGGKHGIPRDIWKVDQTALNGYAKTLQTRLDFWPGVRAKKTTKVF